MGVYSRVIFPRLCEWALNQPFIARHRQELLPEASGKILEIGFGTGLNLPHYPDHVRRIIVVDPNPGMRRQAQRRLDKSQIEVDHRQISGEQLPWESESFDCVVSTFTLCSIDSVDRAVGELYRVLKPGGKFLFLEHGLSPDPKVQLWQRRLNGLQRRLADNCRLDRDIPELVSVQPFARIEVSGGYLEQGPRTHAYVYRGVAEK